MGQSDWTALDDALSVGSLARGVTAGLTPPNGGGSFVYAFNSLATSPGAAGLYTNQVDFAPTDKGGSVRGAVQRGISGGPTNFTPLLFIGLQGPSVTDNGYLLGLADEDPHHIALRKGKLSDGIPGGAPGSSGVLRRSTTTFSAGTWLHLRLDMIFNVNGDVVLRALQSNLNVNPVTTPVWEAIAGMADFTDDALGINSGSAPYVAGRIGFACATKDITRRGYFDHVSIARQVLLAGHLYTPMYYAVMASRRVLQMAWAASRAAWADPEKRAARVENMRAAALRRYQDPQECARLAERARNQIAANPAAHSAKIRAACAARSPTLTTHGGSRTPEYKVWCSMISRCTNPRSTGWKDYGGRGIQVCDAWRGRGGFTRFIEHIGYRPTSEHTVGRVDNDRGYEPGNVRWETWGEQMSNTTRSRLLTINGVTKHAAAWAREAGVTTPTLIGRITRGWPEDRWLDPPTPGVGRCPG